MKKIVSALAISDYKLPSTRRRATLVSSKKQLPSKNSSPKAQTKSKTRHQDILKELFDKYSAVIERATPQTSLSANTKPLLKQHNASQKTLENTARPALHEKPPTPLAPLGNLQAPSFAPQKKAKLKVSSLAASAPTNDPKPAGINRSTPQPPSQPPPAQSA